MRRRLVSLPKLHRERAWMTIYQMLISTPTSYRAF